MSWQLKALRVFLRHAARRSLARQPDSIAARRWFERGAWLNARGRPWTGFVPDQLGQVPALWSARPATTDPVVLYFHGGGYVMGSPRTHAALAAFLTRKTGYETCLPDYRLAPEHPFPAAFDDALAVWQALVARGHDPARIVLGGDSAGGGLALALLAHLCSTRAPRPACVFAFSPFTDLTLSGVSIRTNAASEILLPVQRLEQLRQRVLQGAEASDPRISPLFGSFTKAPPVLIQVARREILRDDSLRMATHLRSFGGTVTVQEWGNLPHVWQYFHGWLPEARKALRDCADFIHQQLPPRPSHDS
ncbi:alpha/beta hydrolase [Roseinatronobacter sp. NSM]|uniref:alpha/beta hydrolase n=1 Tax=Roseinatronobacter sp. NSM TaxID=3457785 RepID=UPI0040353C35